MIPTSQSAQIKGVPLDPRQSLVTWSTFYTNFDTHKLITNLIKKITEW